MLDKARTILIGLSLLVAGALIFLIMGDFDLGSGSGSLEPVDFATLDHKGGGEMPAYLLCHNEDCPNAFADGGALNIGAPSSALVTALRRLSEEQPHIHLRTFDPVKQQFEFLERLPAEKLPSVVVVALKDLPLERTRVTLYSYKPLGDSAYRDHAERINRWTGLIRVNDGF